MVDEQNSLQPKQLRTVFVGDAELPIHFINAVNVRAGAEEFYFTLGTTAPLEITDIKELENIETINAQAVFRFAVTKTVMKQIIDVMKAVYDSQNQQINTMSRSQTEEGV